MKAIMIMFDSLNRHMLSPYGCDWTITPNFQRLADRSAQFDYAFVGSMPCMPARRELHTGRYNFLHRSWGPLEPFDDSMPELMKKSGIYTHLVTDHQHYWEHAGTYHTCYNTYEFIRGQEGDNWRGEVDDPAIPEQVIPRNVVAHFRQDWINRSYIRSEDDFPQARTFQSGMEFIEKNHQADNWFLQLETFDPHEPFHAPERFRQMYPHEYTGKHFDWPPYRRVEESDEEVRHVRYEYAALLSMCDHYLGKVLDLMDQYGLWEDTMLIVNTDHGFLLGEHGWWAKCRQPFYNEVARTPLFIWDPQSGVTGKRRSSLVQTIDLAPTLLQHFGLPIPEHMTGHPLQAAIADDKSVREAALFGIHGGHVNCTDGRYIYMRAPAAKDNRPLFNYTLMPTHMRSSFTMEELLNLQLHPPFTFTKGIQLLQAPASTASEVHHYAFEEGSLLFDIMQDPQQQQPLHNEKIEDEMIRHMIKLMRQHDAPEEQYVRLGLVRKTE